MRSTTAIFVSLAAVSAILGAGCEDANDPPNLPRKKRPAVKPLLQDFPKPAFALVLSGEQHGYLEPCGCSEMQSGGVARRFDLVRKIRSRGWPVAGLDLGGTLKRARDQSKIKFDAILSALTAMDYRAVGLGPEELRLEPTELVVRQPADANADGAPPFVCANVTLLGSPEIGTPLRYRSFEVGGNKVVVTAVISPDEAQNIPYLQDPSTMSIEQPAAALKALREKVESIPAALRVLLSFCPLEQTKALAKEFPEYQLIVSAGGPEDPDGKPITVGKTMIVHVGRKGKYVGVCAVYPDADPFLKFELVDLDMARFDNAPEMIEVMRTYQERLENEHIIENDTPIRHETGYSFVGVKKCGECHTKALAVWEKSKHAQAYESLKKGREGQQAGWISRIYDPECVACHTTGWNPQEVLRYDSGFVSEEATPHLLGQQCENCHGPGSRHTELEEAFKADPKSVDEEQLKAGRVEVQLTKLVAVKRVCYNCHDLDNSPHFEFEKYWDKIKHPGRD